MPNVLFALNFKSSFEGSFMRCIKALAEELERNGGKAVYLFPEEDRNHRWTEELMSSGEPVYFFSGGLAHTAKNTGIIKSIIKNHRIDIIHAHFADYRLNLAIALAMRGNKNIEYIVHAHSNFDSDNAAHEKAASFLANATVYIAVSESIKNTLSINGKRTVTIMNAVDFSRLDRTDPNVKKEALMAEGCEKSILMFGQDFELKGVDFIVNTLMEKDPEHKIQLFVAVSENTDAATKNVKALCGEIPQWIKLLPAREDVGTYFKLADAFVLANRSEGSPYTMIESAYMGVPIVYWDVPGQNELNIPWSVKVRPDDKDEMYKAILEIFREDKQDTYYMGLETKDYAVNNFSLGSWVYEILNIYKNIGKI